MRRSFSLYKFPNPERDGDAERQKRRARERPKRHVGGRI